MNKYKSKIYGIVGSLLAMLLLFLFLWFYYIGQPYTPEDEGIMVSFGDTETGGGTITDNPASQPSQTMAPPPTPSSPSDNDYLTQEDEEALALAKQKKEEEKKRKAEEAERIKKQKEEAARLEAERIAKEKALAEQRAKEQAARDRANKLGALFGPSNNSEGSGGQDDNSGKSGNPAGQGNSGGNSWSLNGRNLKGNLAEPVYKGDQEGVVVVAIRVNAAGKVISATLGSGTTISDKETQRAAISAAQKAVFSEGTSDVIGTITYKFKLR